MADIGKIRSRLSWESELPIEAGVKIMLANIDYWWQAPVWTQAAIAVETSDWFNYLAPANASPIAAE